MTGAIRIALKTACTNNCRVSSVFFPLLQKEYRKGLETEIIGKGMQVGPYTPEIRRVKRASEIASQVGIVQRLNVLIVCDNECLTYIAQSTSLEAFIPILNQFTCSEKILLPNSYFYLGLSCHVK